MQSASVLAPLRGVTDAAESLAVLRGKGDQMCRTAAGRFALGLGMVLAAGLMLLGELIAPRSALGGQPVVLSITTSAEDSGLLNVLLPLFEKRTGFPVKLVEIGTGQALALA